MMGRPTVHPVLSEKPTMGGNHPKWIALNARPKWAYTVIPFDLVHTGVF